MGMNTPSLLLTVALVSVASTSTAAPTHQCSDPCLQAARGAYRQQANAFPCRDAAVQAAGPGFTACTRQYVGCVRACPPA